MGNDGGQMLPCFCKVWGVLRAKKVCLFLSCRDMQIALCDEKSVAKTDFEFRIDNSNRSQCKEAFHKCSPNPGSMKLKE